MAVPQASAVWSHFNTKTVKAFAPAVKAITASEVYIGMKRLPME